MRYVNLVTIRIRKGEISIALFLVELGEALAVYDDRTETNPLRKRFTQVMKRVLRDHCPSEGTSNFTPFAGGYTPYIDMLLNDSGGSWLPAHFTSIEKEATS